MGKTSDAVDAIVIGSGPNGLAAAIEVAKTGRSVTVFEAETTIGGGARSAELTLPGFTHDVCSAIHPFAAASPMFRRLPLAELGLQWIEPPAALAHPLEDQVITVRRSVDATARGLGADGESYQKLMTPFVRDWHRLERLLMGPVGWPRHPVSWARFGLKALRPAASVASSSFSTHLARGLFAGIAAHGMLPLDKPQTAGIGLSLGLLAHVVGWPLPRGGAQRISDALAGYLKSLGGRIVPAARIQSVDDLPPARAVLCDLSPKPLLRIAGHLFPGWYRRALEQYRYGAGVFKLDWALDGPIPWAFPECSEAGTVHLGGTMEEIALSEDQISRGVPAERPFVLLAQPTLFDPTRAPEGKHIVWAYCHTPNGSTFDMTARIEAQIERYAPGFTNRIIARSTMPPARIESHNANFVGGDIGSGAMDWRQFFTRPTFMLYSTPAPGIYLCSAATPPGVGVHGMCGYFAAQRALRRELWGNK